MDSTPVLAITGQTFHDLIGMRYQQEVDLLQLFEDVASTTSRSWGRSTPHALVDAACRAALGARGVAHINFPNDWQEKSDGELSPMNESGAHVERRGRPPIVVPQARLAEDAPRPCSTPGRRPSSWSARGALGAGDEVEQVAERLAAPSSRPLLGKAVLPDDSPYTTGGLGLLGTLPSEKAMEECDSPPDRRHRTSRT